MRYMSMMFSLFVAALIAGVSSVSAASVDPAARECVMRASQAAAAGRNNRAALSSLYDRYLGDPFARQAAQPGRWDKFSQEEKGAQRVWAKKRALAVVPQLLGYASAKIEVQRQKGRIVYGKAILREGGSTPLAWYLIGGACRFYDLRAGGVVLSQLVGSYRKR